MGPTKQQHNKKHAKDRTCFSRFVQHPARKWSGSILTTPKLAQGTHYTIQH